MVATRWRAKTRAGPEEKCCALESVLGAVGKEEQFGGAREIGLDPLTS